MKKKKIYNKARTEKKKNSIILIIAAGIVLIGLITMVLLLIFNNSSNIVVFYVNGTPVTKEEFQIHMNELKSTTFAYFVEKYGASDSKTFWTDDFDGEVPLEKLKTDTAKEIIEIKIKQIIAKENGIIDFIKYQDFKKRLFDENRRRLEAKKKNEPIYGPTQYSEGEYYRYLLGNMEEELIKKLAKTTLAVSEEQEKEYYENNLDQFKAPSKIIADMIIVEYGSENGSESENESKVSQDIINKAKEICGQIKTKVDETSNFEDAIKDMDNMPGIKVYSTSRVFNSKTKRYDMTTPEVLTQAETLPIGQVSDIIEVVGKSFNIMKVKERTTEGYRPFEEVKDLVNKRLIAEKFDKMVSDMLKEAEIVFNEKVYRDLKFN